MKSQVIKRSIIVEGHKTSVSLEEPFWIGLKEIALGMQTTLSKTVGEIDAHRQHGNLSSAIRLFVLERARKRSQNPISEFSADRSSASSLNGGSAPDHA